MTTCLLPFLSLLCEQAPHVVWMAISQSGITGLAHPQTVHRKPQAWGAPVSYLHPPIPLKVSVLKALVKLGILLPPALPDATVLVSVLPRNSRQPTEMSMDPRIHGSSPHPNKSYWWSGIYPVCAVGAARQARNLPDKPAISQAGQPTFRDMDIICGCLETELRNLCGHPRDPSLQV